MTGRKKNKHKATPGIRELWKSVLGLDFGN